MHLLFVTGNANKLKEFKAIVDAELGADSGITVDSVDIDLPELQGLPEEVAREKCANAVAALRKRGDVAGDTLVLVEDTSLVFTALGDGQLPGVYIKWFLKSLGCEGLIKLLAGFDDKTAYAQCIFALSALDSQNVSTFIGRCEGSIAAVPRGERRFGWDPIFCPREASSAGASYADMADDEKNQISHRGRALRLLLAALKQQKQQQQRQQ